ncbi:MAG: inosine/xanthosine triphosphatase [Anaerolineales bacterium]|nr:inosine/xanthosine triphosphatase [Anaerolineales bacterium]
MRYDFNESVGLIYKIAVGSRNPVKIAAVRSVTEQLWPACMVQGLSVPSGVSEMPMSAAECIAGARNRATAAREQLQADFGIGLEGGVQETEVGMMLGGWIVVVDGHGREGVACSARIVLPAFIAQRVRAGEELGPVMDDVVGDHNTKQKGGAVGILTQGLASRESEFASAVMFAFAPFISPEFYK